MVSHERGSGEHGPGPLSMTGPGSDFLLRALFTLGALLVYRLGCYLPLPQLDAEVLKAIYGPNPVAAGGAAERISIFALGVSPIFSALILTEALRLFSGFRRWERANAGYVAQMILVAALAIAALQAFGIALALESFENFVTDPGWSYRFFMIVSLVTATAFLYWLSELINRFGLGNGFWLLLAAPTLVLLPKATVAAFLNATLVVGGQLSLALFVLYVASGAGLVVAATRARPCLNRDGALLWPIILAATFLSWILALAIIFLPAGAEKTVMTLQPQHPVNVLLFSLLVPVIAWWRARGHEDGASALVIALIATVLAVPGYLLVHFGRLPLALDGQWLIILTTLALAILTQYRGARDAGEDA